MFAPTEGPAVSITLSNKVTNPAPLNSAMSAQEERNGGRARSLPSAGACRGSAEARRRALANLMD